MIRWLTILLLALTVNAQEVIQGNVNFSGAHTHGTAAEIFADSFTSIENGTTNTLLTLANLTNSTITGAAYGWAYIPGSGSATTFSHTYLGSNGFALNTSIAIGSGLYSTAGSRSVNYDTSVATNEVAEFILPGGQSGSYSNVSFGMLIQFCNTNNTATVLEFDPVTINGPPFCTCQQFISTLNNEIHAYASMNDGSTNRGGAIPIQPCQLYYLTLKRDIVDGICSFTLNDAATGSFVGQSVTSMGTTNVSWNIQLGNTSSDTTPGNIYWDDFVVNYYTAFYPLGPGSTIPPPPPPPVPQIAIIGQGGEQIIGQGGESILGQ